MIAFYCPSCRQPMQIEDVAAGTVVACVGCGASVQVPASVMMPAAPQWPLHQPQPTVVVNVAGGRAGKHTNGLGVAALVLGILACLTAWIPVIGCTSIPLAGLGLLFALIGLLTALAGRRSSAGMPFAGLVVCGVALALQFIVTAGVVAAPGIYRNARDASTRPADASSNPRPAHR